MIVYRSGTLTCTVHDNNKGLQSCCLHKQCVQQISSSRTIPCFQQVSSSPTVRLSKVSADKSLLSILLAIASPIVSFIPIACAVQREACYTTISSLVHATILPALTAYRSLAAKISLVLPLLHSLKCSLFGRGTVQMCTSIFGSWVTEKFRCRDSRGSVHIIFYSGALCVKMSARACGSGLVADIFPTPLARHAGIRFAAVHSEVEGPSDKACG